jgi:hypothetical protein
MITEGQYRICCEKARDSRDTIILQEKLDGTCVAVAKINGEIVPLIRAGYRADKSPYHQHRLFYWWAMRSDNWLGFNYLLDDGERVVGEWLLQAHGTRYRVEREQDLFVAFDIMRGTTRVPYNAFLERVGGVFTTPGTLHVGSPVSIDHAKGYIDLLGSGHGAIDPVEGFIWRVERGGKIDFLAKWVRPDKEDGKYLPEVSGKEPVWNWKPEDL